MKEKIKNVLNKPLPMLIALTLIIVILLIYIYKNNFNSTIYVGEIVEDDLVVQNVHYFANNDMNYFFAVPAVYLSNDKNIYSYQIGYYAVSNDKEYYELAARSGKLENSTSLKAVINEQSGWNFAEKKNNKYFFDDQVMKYIDNIHFVVKASTNKDEITKPDILIDYQIDLTKLTK